MDRGVTLAPISFPWFNILHSILSTRCNITASKQIGWKLWRLQPNGLVLALVSDYWLGRPIPIGYVVRRACSIGSSWPSDTVSDFGCKMRVRNHALEPLLFRIDLPYYDGFIRCNEKVGQDDRVEFGLEVWGVVKTALAPCGVRPCGVVLRRVANRYELAARRDAERFVDMALSASFSKMNY